MSPAQAIIKATRHLPSSSSELTRRKPNQSEGPIRGRSELSTDYHFSVYPKSKRRQKCLCKTEALATWRLLAASCSNYKFFCQLAIFSNCDFFQDREDYGIGEVTECWVWRLFGYFDNF
ncbi:hypothetical protein JTE90_003939 [Oedothorax gibbosus]|uniref:Uncharacterized protein n=1 Tax=Oedothorax gibbosus TaxID=931172 RepID=A0AAV6UYI6_9ARAC|nr:hypothetical protein JTE90_003939 [Oedothorax gibbosus]